MFSCQFSIYNGSYIKPSSTLARALFRACPSSSYSPAKGTRLDSRRPATRLPAITLDRVVLLSNYEANRLSHRLAISHVGAPAQRARQPLIPTSSPAVNALNYIIKQLHHTAFTATTTIIPSSSIKTGIMETPRTRLIGQPLRR